MKPYIQNSIDAIERCMGIRFKPTQMNKILNKHPDLKDELEQGVDTYSREWLMNVVGEELIGRECPCNGDGSDVGNKFYADLKEACKKQKIEIL